MLICTFAREEDQQNEKKNVLEDLFCHPSICKIDEWLLVMLCFIIFYTEASTEPLEREEKQTYQVLLSVCANLRPLLQGLLLHIKNWS